MKKILVPVDFSDTASHALDFAVELNELLKGKIFLMHVLEFPAYSFSVAGEVHVERPEVFYQKAFIEQVLQRLDEWSKRVTEARQDVDVKMKYGNAYQAIGNEIADEKMDLIVMGSKGASGLKEVFIGSNAERVIRHATCPVLTVKGETSLKGISNMVFASDLSEEQDRVADRVKDLQQLLGVNMHVLRVRTPHNFLSEVAAWEQLETFAKRNELNDYTLNTIEADYAEEGIVAFAEKVHPGLIVMGTHGKTGLGHLLGGSRAEDVANRSVIPVLTFKIDS